MQLFPGRTGISVSIQGNGNTEAEGSCQEPFMITTQSSTSVGRPKRGYRVK